MFFLGKTAKAAWNTLGKSFNNLWSQLSAFVKNIFDSDFVQNTAKGFSGSGLTNAQQEANAFSAQQAQEQRAWEQEMSETAFQRQVADMRAAGVNPALLYGAGSNGANPSGGAVASSVSPGSPTLSMYELIQMLLAKKQGDLLDAQVRNTDSETDKNKASTEYQKLVNKYYPKVTDTQIDKILSDMGVNSETIERMKSEVDVNRMEVALKETQNIIEKAKSNESSAYYKAIRELAEADTAKAKEEKREIAARAAMEELERGFMDKYGAKMGSSEYIAIASAVAGLFGIDLNVFSKSPIRGLLESLGLIGNEKPSGAAKGGGSR